MSAAPPVAPPPPGTGPEAAGGLPTAEAVMPPAELGAAYIPQFDRPQMPEVSNEGLRTSVREVQRVALEFQQNYPFLTEPWDHYATLAEKAMSQKAKEAHDAANRAAVARGEEPVEEQQIKGRADIAKLLQDTGDETKNRENIALYQDMFQSASDAIIHDANTPVVKNEKGDVIKGDDGKPKRVASGKNIDFQVGALNELFALYDGARYVVGASGENAADVAKILRPQQHEAEQRVSKIKSKLVTTTLEEKRAEIRKRHNTTKLDKAAGWLLARYTHTTDEARLHRRETIRLNRDERKGLQKTPLVTLATVGGQDPAAELGRSIFLRRQTSKFPTEKVDRREVILDGDGKPAIDKNGNPIMKVFKQKGHPWNKVKDSEIIYPTDKAHLTKAKEEALALKGFMNLTGESMGQSGAEVVKSLHDREAEIQKAFKERPGNLAGAEGREANAALEALLRQQGEDLDRLAVIPSAEPDRKEKSLADKWIEYRTKNIQDTFRLRYTQAVLHGSSHEAIYQTDANEDPGVMLENGGTRVVYYADGSYRREQDDGSMSERAYIGGKPWERQTSRQRTKLPSWSVYTPDERGHRMTPEDAWATYNETGHEYLRDPGNPEDKKRAREAINDVLAFTERDADVALAEVNQEGTRVTLRAEIADDTANLTRRQTRLTAAEQRVTDAQTNIDAALAHDDKAEAARLKKEELVPAKRIARATRRGIKRLDKTISRKTAELDSLTADPAEAAEHLDNARAAENRIRIDEAVLYAGEEVAPRVSVDEHIGRTMLGRAWNNRRSEGDLRTAQVDGTTLIVNNGIMHTQNGRERGNWRIDTQTGSFERTIPDPANPGDTITQYFTSDGHELPPVTTT